MTDILNLRSVEDLLRALEAGATPKYMLFWGHQPNADGSIGKGCFSQWFEASFEVDGQPYLTAEHFMMAEKARLFGDVGTRAGILAARTPAEAKKLGRGVTGFDDALWERARFDIVVRANEAKFSQNRALRDYLLTTGDRVLVEASPVDRIWGIGLAADDRRALEPRSWCGLNLLGFALMEVRARLASD
ncbi:NADAR family protein [Roseateles amylovorans]|uniref:NADAR family protein n=1 Tax=Roseateles amylovorans TaxID=2978473 RepID=A0ABY6AZ73_9BURK|nr:NADAR family protein [Roseateles amylovorans]UXH77987.1 NADAR family protein [Roseateles amylovorans]